MTGFRRVLIMKSIIDILKKAYCSFFYNDQTQKITTVGGEDITPHLFAVFEKIDELEGEYWREKVAKSFGISVDMLFPTKEKIGKYNFVLDKKPKVYISGKISGLSEKEYKNNFNSAELLLTGLGYDVVNPVSYPEIPNGTWEEYMKRDLKLLLGCDYIHMLDGWEDSRGARWEFNTALELNIERLYLDDNGKVL